LISSFANEIAYTSGVGTRKIFSIQGLLTMKSSIRNKLENLSERLQELNGLLAEPSVIANQERFRELSKEYAEIQPIAACFQQYNQSLANVASAKEMLLQESDAEMKALVEEELTQTQATSEGLEQELQLLILPKDPDDNSNTFVEIRAGTGGDEAALFAGDLARMYTRYAERRGWQIEILNRNEGEHGGYKEIIMRVSGQSVYSQFKFESGGHRVQRVPETEAQGRIHTSACTVAIMPEVQEVDEVAINPNDLKVDTYRASGAGGQHVNKTDSAIRITHLPTGIVVECQDERSQHKNRARAMSLLRSRLLQAERERQRTEQAETRRNLVGSGDRSERIRTYNFQQGRVTDHRINLTLYKLEDILEGNLNHLIEPLQREHQMDLLASMGE
jgi:peptide chain release factor 1